MILLRSILLLLFLTCSCNQIMIREYESEFKSSFFRDADCRRVAAHSFIFSKDHTSYTIDKTSITHKTNDQVVWTKDINKAIKASREIRAGTVYINNYEEGMDSTIPLGGYKQSGIGRDSGYQALDNYLQVKSTWAKIS